MLSVGTVCMCLRSLCSPYLVWHNTVQLAVTPVSSLGLARLWLSVHLLVFFYPYCLTVDLSVYVYRCFFFFLPSLFDSDGLSFFDYVMFSKCV